MCPPAGDPQLLVSVAEMAKAQKALRALGFGGGKPTSLRMLGVGSGNLEDFMEEMPFALGLEN